MLQQLASCFISLGMRQKNTNRMRLMLDLKSQIPFIGQSFLSIACAFQNNDAYSRLKINTEHNVCIYNSCFYRFTIIWMPLYQITNFQYRGEPRVQSELKHNTCARVLSLTHIASMAFIASMATTRAHGEHGIHPSIHTYIPLLAYIHTVHTRIYVPTS